MKILIIEDHTDIIDSIRMYLHSEEYKCEYSTLYNDALSLIGKEKHDCYIIDLGLPDGDGMNLIPVIKEKNPDSSIIVLSAKIATDKKVEALNKGADDYITKPFNLPELNARIHANLRKKNKFNDDEISFNELLINTATFELFVHDKLIPLTKKEFDLLLFLISNKKKVITKQSISEHLWGKAEIVSSDIIYTHVKNLRKKLAGGGCNDYIQNINRIGYRFTEV